MMLDSIRAFALEIPFVTTFKHAAAAHARTHALWIEARDQNGLVGFGEGCPRWFVTGETFDSARRFIVSQTPDLLKAIRDPGALYRWTENHASAIDANPAAWTAIELALLDLLGQDTGQPVESLLGLKALAGRFVYTAVLGDASPAQFEAQLERYVRTGFRQFKVKLSGNVARDRAKTDAIVAAGISPRMVRADANNLWGNSAEAIEHVKALDFPFYALEEPLQPGDWEGMRRVGSALGAKIVLDESLLRVSQLDRLGNLAQRWIVNLRVSKMGGLLRSLRFVASARQRGLPVVIGAHVGETSLLTRAALTLAHVARDILHAQEGAFGTHLLARDVVDRPIMFGHGGAIDAASLPRSGRGGLQMEFQRSRYQNFAQPLLEEQLHES